MRLPIRRFLQNYNKPLVLESSLQKIFHRFSAIIIRAKEQGERDWKNRASPKPANSTPIVEPFINTSPSLTFPLTRLRKHTTVEQADGRQNGARLQERERERERLDSARVIRPVFADRYRSPIDGMEVFPGRDSGGGVHSRLSRRNDLVRGLNSRSHSLLNGTTWSRESARAHASVKRCKSPFCLPTVSNIYDSCVTDFSRTPTNASILSKPFRIDFFRNFLLSLSFASLAVEFGGSWLGSILRRSVTTTDTLSCIYLFFYRLVVERVRILSLIA